MYSIKYTRGILILLQIFISASSKSTNHENIEKEIWNEEKKVCLGYSNQ